MNITVEEEIEQYIANQNESKRSDIIALHELLLHMMPARKSWFLDGKNSENQIVSNSNVGYGHYTIKYANGTTKAFYQIGMSTNTTGISIYIKGIEDKTHLVKNYVCKIGKAAVSGYGIKFKNLKEINVTVLREAIRYGIK